MGIQALESGFDLVPMNPLIRVGNDLILNSRHIRTATKQDRGITIEMDDGHRHFTDDPHVWEQLQMMATTVMLTQHRT